MRDVVRVTPGDMVTHIVAMNLQHEAAARLVFLGRQRNASDLYGHVPAGSVRHGQKWRKGLRRLGITAKVSLA